MTWAHEWVGLPYEAGGRGPRAYDCLGLFVALHRARFGRVVAVPGETGDARSRRATFERAKASGDAREVTGQPVAEGDALLFRLLGGLHVGYALDARSMLHIVDGTQASVIEPWQGARWRSRLIGAWRYD